MFLNEKKRMFGSDYFQYSRRFAPSCFQPPECQLPQFEQVMKFAILDYQQSSAQLGIKHHNALMSSGLTAGEAGMIALQMKKGVVEKRTPIFQFLVDCMKQYFDVNAEDHENAMLHLMLGDIPTPQLESRATIAIKAFLRDVHYKSKGYTFQLKQIVQELKLAREQGLL